MQGIKPYKNNTVKLYSIYMADDNETAAIPIIKTSFYTVMYDINLANHTAKLTYISDKDLNYMVDGGKLIESDSYEKALVTIADVNGVILFKNISSRNSYTTEPTLLDNTSYGYRTIDESGLGYLTNLYKELGNLFKKELINCKWFMSKNENNVLPEALIPLIDYNESHHIKDRDDEMDFHFPHLSIKCDHKNGITEYGIYNGEYPKYYIESDIIADELDFRFDVTGLMIYSISLKVSSIFNTKFWRGPVNE